MAPYINLHPIGPDTDPAHFQAMLRANTDAVEMNNMGNLARRHGQLDRALALHLEALDLKIRGFGEESVQAALSFNTLGETYIKLAAAAASHGADGDADKRSYTDAAEHALRKALRANDDRALGGLEMGPRGDAAVARDNLARALELRGAMGEARAMRLRGLKAGRVLCGSDKCYTPTGMGAMLSEGQLKACGGCRSVFYCSAACQRQDWSSRHKPLCKTYGAAVGKAAITEDGTTGNSDS